VFAAVGIVFGTMVFDHERHAYRFRQALRVFVPPLEISHLDGVARPEQGCSVA
jgi:hypothetical protein